jgi:hypothetical protein
MMARPGAALLLLAIGCRPTPERPSPSLDQVLTSRRDLWGEEALSRPGGPTYEYFAGLLPPPRYVNAAFRHYPIVLSSPGGRVKARLVGNGSAVNARGAHRSWHDLGVPVVFRCGPDEDLYGNDLARLDGPRYAEGHLPIVRSSYRVEDAVYEQEAFAAEDERGTVFVKFSLTRGENGRVTAEVETDEVARVGDVVAAGPGWKWFPGRKRFQADLAPSRPAVLAIRTLPGPGAAPEAFDRERERCAAAWKALLERSARIDVPEPVVDRAWRSMLIGCHLLLNGDRMCYSAANQYEGVYVAEGSDTVRALLLYGHAAEARRMMVPVFERRRKGLESHQAAFKLQMLAHHYWITRDPGFLRDERARWEPEVERLATLRDPSTGLLPREQYCGDVATPVVSLNVQANGWRALRDMAIVLAESKEGATAERLARAAADLRAATLAAVEKSVRRDVDPPFLPVALFGGEEPHDRVPATKMGSYYNLMAPYVLGSGVFGRGSPWESLMLDYLHRRGAIAMGMIRSHPRPDLFTVKEGTNHLYGLRYGLVNLERDDVDRALAGFYGTLAQGFTRETFVGAESVGLVPLDPGGRPMYLPPNSAANAHFLWLLRELLVQESDLDDDGRPETLRLLFGTPRAWLEDGKEIRLERLPTAFGEISLRAWSRLAKGEVEVEFSPPSRAPGRLLLRARLPEGRRVVAARVGDVAIPVDASGTADLSGFAAAFHVRVRFEAR